MTYVILAGLVTAMAGIAVARNTSVRISINGREFAFNQEEQE